jgi:cell division protein FtsZ
MGKAMMGTGEAEGERRAIDAAEAAISNPLLEDVSMRGARGVLINITGGPDMTLYEVDEAANRIREEVDPEANIIFGSTFDDKLAGRIRISVVATGMDAELAAQKPTAEPAQQPAAPVARAAVAAPSPPPTRMPMPAAAYAAPPAPVYAIAPVSLTEAEAAPVVAPAAAELAPPRIEAVEARAVAQATARGLALPRATEPMAVRPSPAARPAVAPNPFAEAAMENGARAAQPKAKVRMPSLFERVTGTGASRATPAAEEPSVAPARQPVATPAAAQPAPRLAPLDPTAPAPNRARDEDLLEIPAFLRRQAN